MALIKIKSGLLERSNYFMFSSFVDFGGVGISYRDSYSFYIQTDNAKIERPINYANYMVVIEKENFPIPLNEDDMDKILFYVSDAFNIYGIEDRTAMDGVSVDKQSPFMKLIYIDGFVQSFVSQNGKVWENLGGVNLYNNKEIKYQGFKKESNNEFKLKDYKVYSSPYLTLLNYPQGYIFELLDSGSKLVKQAEFSLTQKAEIFLDYCMEGYINVKDEKGKVVFKSELLSFDYGDTYINSDLELDVEYKGKLLPTDKDTEFDLSSNAYSYVTIKAKEGKSYSNLTVSTTTETTDLVTLSLDSVDYSDTVTIPSLTWTHPVNVYISIEKQNASGFELGDFLLEINN